MFSQFNWNSVPYFKKLTETNRLARELKLQFGRVSGLQGLEDAISTMQRSRGFVCVADSSDGLLNLDYTANADRVKIVFLALRHAENDMKAREEALAKLQEVFRQFMSHLLIEKNRLHCLGIYLDDKIRFHEIGQYFASGCACAYFQIGVSTAVDLRYNDSEWLKEEETAR